MPDFEEDSLDDRKSARGKSDAGSMATRTPRRLPTDDGSGYHHRLVDNNTSDEYDISLAIAALACRINQPKVIFNIESDGLQQMARFNPSDGFMCLTKPDRLLIPIFLSSLIGNNETEA